MKKIRVLAVAHLIMTIFVCLLTCGHSEAQDCGSGMGGSSFTGPGEYLGDDCSSVLPLSIAGSGAVSKPTDPQNPPQYSASGGIGPYTWAISGVGASMNQQTGQLSLSDSACGPFTIVATDSCGATAFLTGRVSNNNAGRWQQVEDCYYNYCCDGNWADYNDYSVSEEIIAGDIRTVLYSAETHHYGQCGGCGNIAVGFHNTPRPRASGPCTPGQQIFCGPPHPGWYSECWFKWSTGKTVYRWVCQ
jgi:hypothetical protein